MSASRSPSQAQRKKPRIQTQHKWRIVRGDNVQIISGKGRGGQGLVKKVLRHKNRLVVEGELSSPS